MKGYLQLISSVTACNKDKLLLLEMIDRLDEFTHVLLAELDSWRLFVDLQLSSKGLVFSRSFHQFFFRINDYMSWLFDCAEFREVLDSLQARWKHEGVDVLFEFLIAEVVMHVFDFGLETIDSTFES